jgi:antitoxin ParD1/3/4
MTIQLRPELEELVRQDVERGPYRTVVEFVEHAVTLLHEQESWLAAHRVEVAKQIEQGWEAAEAGQLVDAEQVKANMEKRKQAWLEQQRSA